MGWVEDQILACSEEVGWVRISDGEEASGREAEDILVVVVVRLVRLVSEI